MSRPSSPDITGLELSLLVCVLDGMETTLILLRLVSGRPVPAVRTLIQLGEVRDDPTTAEETDVLEALRALESQGLVVSERWEGRDRPLPGANIPEYELRRPELVWWGPDGGRA